MADLKSTLIELYENYSENDFIFPVYSLRPYLCLCYVQDLLANPKCSLLVAKDPEDRTDLVITLHGDAISVCFYSSLLFITP